MPRWEADLDTDDCAEILFKYVEVIRVKVQRAVELRSDFDGLDLNVLGEQLQAKENAPS